MCIGSPPFSAGAPYFADVHLLSFVINALRPLDFVSHFAKLACISKFDFGHVMWQNYSVERSYLEGVVAAIVVFQSFI